MHFVRPEFRASIFENLKQFTNPNGVHAMNVFVEKPFVEVWENRKNGVDRFRWKSGEIFMQYHAWLLHKTEEIIFDCNSGGVLRKHCANIVVAERM